MSPVPKLIAIASGVLLCTLAVGQSVRDEGLMDSIDWRAANKLFPESTAREWPTLEAGTAGGTQIWVTGNFYNSDLTLTTLKSYGRDRLLEIAKRLAIAIGRPQSDFIVTRGRRLIQADLEFNKMIRIKGNSSESSVPLGAALKFLHGTDLPRPLGVYIRARKAGGTSIDDRVLTDSTILDANGVDPQSVVRYRSERSPIGLIGLLVPLTFLALALGYGVVIMVRLAMGKPEKPDQVQVPPALSLTETQVRYEALRKTRARRLLPLFPFLLVVALPAIRPAMEQSDDWIPPGFSRWMGTGMSILMLLLLLAMGATILRQRSRTQPTEEDPETKPLGAIRFAMLAGFVPILVLAMLTVTRSTLLLQIPSAALKPLIFTFAGLPICAMIVILSRSARSGRERLQAGDGDYDFAEELCKKSGTRLRAFTLVKSKRANAFATLFGSIYMTTAAREKLPEDERRAVIAHEIGHLKYRHVPALLILVLVVDAVLLAGLFQLERFATRQAVWATWILASPVAINILLFLVIRIVSAPVRKRNELSADRFALESIGEYPTVARALARIHLLGGAPHTYLGFDNLAGTHPSLMLRLESLRQAAGEVGMAVDDSSLRPLFDSPDPEVGSVHGGVGSVEIG